MKVIKSVEAMMAMAAASAARMKQMGRGVDIQGMTNDREWKNYWLIDYEFTGIILKQ